MATVRKYLSGGKRGRSINLDMEAVYRLLDSGLTVDEVAQRLGVSKTTLYRGHRKYQAQLKVLGEAAGEIFDDMDMD